MRRFLLPLLLALTLIAPPLAVARVSTRGNLALERLITRLTQADNLSNTEDSLQTSAFLYGFDGTTWDRIRSTAGVLNVIVDSSAQGVLHSNSPTTEVAILSLFDGSAETQIATTNLGASKSITITGSGRLTKMCLISSLGTPIAEDGSVIFFDADPSISADTTDLTLSEAQTVVAVVSFRGADYLDNFATSKTNCQLIDESFHSITHVVYHQEGSTMFDDEDMEMHLWYRRNS